MKSIVEGGRSAHDMQGSSLGKDSMRGCRRGQAQMCKVSIMSSRPLLVLL